MTHFIIATAPLTPNRMILRHAVTILVAVCITTPFSVHSIPVPAFTFNWESVANNFAQGALFGAGAAASYVISVKQNKGKMTVERIKAEKAKIDAFRKVLEAENELADQGLLRDVVLTNATNRTVVVQTRPNATADWSVVV